MKSVTLAAVLLAGSSSGAAQAGDCTVISVCERSRCLDVPGQFIQTFDTPSGGVGATMFTHGAAYVFASNKDVVPAIKAGKLLQDTRYVVWPDETDRGGVWVDATIYAVKRLTWDGETPSLSPTTSLMACPDGNG